MKIFVISLKSLPDRAKLIQTQMDKLGLDFEFFAGVDCRNSIPEKYKILIDTQQAKKRLGRNIENGEIGAGLSHLLLYKKIINENINEAIVLEDDCIITNKLIDFINIKNKSDFVMLCHYRGYVDKLIKTDKQIDFYSVPFMPFSAAGYYLNNKTAKILLDSNPVLSYVADWSLPLNDLVDVTITNPRIIQHPRQQNQTSIIGRPKSQFFHRLRMLTMWDYICNRQTHGGIIGYIKRVYLRFLYKNISPKYEEQ